MQGPDVFLPPPIWDDFRFEDLEQDNGSETEDDEPVRGRDVSFLESQQKRKAPDMAKSNHTSSHTNKRLKADPELQDSLSAQLKQFESLHQRLKTGDPIREPARVSHPKSVAKRGVVRKMTRGDGEKATTRETSKYQPPAFRPGTLLQLLPKSSPHLVFANAGNDVVKTFCSGTGQFYCVSYGNCCSITPRYIKRFLSSSLEALNNKPGLDPAVYEFTYLPNANEDPVPYSAASNDILCQSFGTKPALFLEHEQHSVLLIGIFGLCAIAQPRNGMPVQRFLVQFSKRAQPQEKKPQNGINLE